MRLRLASMWSVYLSLSDGVAENRLGFTLSREIILSILSLSSKADIPLFFCRCLSLSVYLSLLYFSSAPSTLCSSIIFPQKPFQGSFVKAAQYMNFTWVAHSLLSILPLTTAGSVFPYSLNTHIYTVHTCARTHKPAWPRKSMRAQSQIHKAQTEVHSSPLRRVLKLAAKLIQNTDEMPQIKDVLMAAWCFIDHKPC